MKRGSLSFQQAALHSFFYNTIYPVNYLIVLILSSRLISHTHTEGYPRACFSVVASQS